MTLVWKKYIKKTTLKSLCSTYTVKSHFSLWFDWNNRYFSLQFPERQVPEREFCWSSCIQHRNEGHAKGISEVTKRKVTFTTKSWCSKIIIQFLLPWVFRSLIWTRENLLVPTQKVRFVCAAPTSWKVTSRTSKLQMIQYLMVGFIVVCLIIV